MIATGIRRNLTNIATKDFGLVIMDDVHRKSVTSAEVKTSSAMVASVRAYFQTVCESWRAFASMPAPSLATPYVGRKAFLLTCVAWMGDATNSSIWRRKDCRA